jgi:hypothetical protein
MSTSIDAHDPSVGVKRRHLPSFAGEEWSNLVARFNQFEESLIL